MARVTVEDCVIKIPNRFKLVMMAAQRSRELSVGLEPTLDRDNDKNSVLALREIADETVSLDELEESIVSGLQRRVEADEPVEDDDELLNLAEAFKDPVILAAEGEDADDADDMAADAAAVREDEAEDPLEEAFGAEPGEESEDAALEEEPGDGDWPDMAGGFEDVAPEDIDADD